MEWLHGSNSPNGAILTFTWLRAFLAIAATSAEQLSIVNDKLHYAIITGRLTVAYVDSGEIRAATQAAMLTSCTTSGH